MISAIPSKPVNLFCVASPAKNGIKKPTLLNANLAADAITANVELPRWKTTRIKML
ncbi:hypothetical protein D3C80_1721200 [compost metagenome]